LRCSAPIHPTPNANWRISATSSPCGRPGRSCRGQADDLGWFARELARLPFPFTIRRPEALAETLRDHAAALLGRAAGAGPA
jgi:hypothetical protein